MEDIPLHIVQTRDNDPHPDTQAAQVTLSEAFRAIKRAYPESEILLFLIHDGHGMLFTDMAARQVLSVAAHLMERTEAIELEESDGKR